MSDKIQIDPSPDRSNITGRVRPESDGHFVVKLLHRATGNGQPGPWMNGSLTGTPGLGTVTGTGIGWQDGSTSLMMVVDWEGELQGGQTYTFKGQATNKNASADEVKLTIERW